MPALQPREIHALFLDAFNRADLEALVSLYEPGALFVTGDGIAVGHEAIRAAYRQIHSGGARMELETRTVLESGEGLAVLHASYTFHREGQARSGLSTEVVRRQADGTWRFVIDEPRTPDPRA